MAGVFLSLDVQDDAARAAFARLIRVTGDLKPALEEIGESLVSTTQQRFLDSRDPGGRKWQHLAHATVLSRLGGRKNIFKKRGGLRIGARRKLTGGGIKPLVDHGILRSGIHWRVQGDSVLVQTTPLKYAAIHQFGGKAGRGRKVTIPARPYLGLSDGDRSEVQDILARRIKAAV